MKKLLIPLLLLTACQKQPQEYQVGQTVYLNGINPRKSFVPYNCCTCPCVVTDKYMVLDVQYYNISDQVDSTLTHLYGGQLKP